MIIRGLMLMYSKEANNRKQEIDRQHHTIPNQRANDKHHGNVYNLLFRYGKVRSQNCNMSSHMNMCIFIAMIL